MYEFVLSEVLKKYDVKYRKIFDCQKGYRNEIWPVLTSDNQMINVTFYKRETGIIDRIHRADEVSEYLASMGMPSRKRFDKRILTFKNGETETSIGVYEYLPGETIPWEAYTMSHIKTLGSTMSDMHFMLSDKQAANFPSVYDEYLSIIECMKAYFSDINVQDAIKQKLKIRINAHSLNRYEKLLQEYKSKEGQQVLHMDFVRGNILYDGKQISGILDFEKTAIGHTVVDISRTLAFLLVDCKYKEPRKVCKYFLLSGYQKRGQNKDIGDDAVRNQLVEMFLSHDLYKFMLHNPYESLIENEHYMRTRDMLLGLGVISLIK